MQPVESNIQFVWKHLG